MEQYTRYLGFDVSAETIVMAEARGRCRARELDPLPTTKNAVGGSVLFVLMLTNVVYQQSANH